MATSSHRQTAEIIPFPQKGRRLGGNMCALDDKRKTDIKTPEHTTCDFSGAWYHEAALRETKASAKLSPSIWPKF